MAQGAVAARRPVIIAAAFTLVLAVLSGCSKDDSSPPPSPRPTPTNTSTTLAQTPTPTPTPTPPAKPANWSGLDAAAAVDAAIYFKDLYNYALATGDVAEWRALAGPECGFCSGIADDIEKVYSAGGHYEGGDITVSATTLVNADRGLFEVQHAYESATGRIIAADGSAEENVPAASGFMVFEVARDDLSSTGNWRLSRAEGRDEPLPPSPGDDS
jgi:hypothetical protein